MRDTYAEYVAWETKLGADMLALAQKEGHAPQPPELGKKPAARKIATNASPQTIAIMRRLAKGPATTAELGKVAKCLPDSTSSRLSGLRNGQYVEAVGAAPLTNPLARRANMWALGPRGKEWLERYGVTV